MIVPGFSGAQHRIMQPLGTPKPREECIPFTYTLADPGEGYNAADAVKAQEKFVKGLSALSKPKRTAKRKDGYSRHATAFLKIKFPVAGRR